MAKNTSVMGLYPDKVTVSEAVSSLHKAGYRAVDIAVLAAENSGSKDFAHEKRSKGLAGAAIGSAAGALAGGALALVVAMRLVAVPGLDPLVNAGPWLATMAGAGFGAAAGWLIGLFLCLGMAEYVAVRYVGRMGRGGLLLSVHCDSPEWCARARKILQDTGARSISTAAEASADYAASDKPMPRDPKPLVEHNEAA